MNTTRVTREERLSGWAAILQARQEGGQTIRRYCEDSGVNETSYYYWQRQLRAAACESLVTHQENTPSGWVLYTLTESGENASELTVEMGACLIHVED